LNLFDQLVRQDAHQALIPGLATAWTVINDDTWEFQLRPGVTFSDGTPFGPADVIASVRHVAGITNSPSSFKPYIAGIKDIEVVGPDRIRIVTNGPRPLLPNDLSRIAIISHSMADAPSSAFDAGQAIGTGPFRLLDWTPGASIDLAPNPHYWGGAPGWQHVRIRFMADDGTRVAALLAGDVDVIDAVPPELVATLQAKHGMQTVGMPGNRMIYLHIDSARDVSPDVRDTADRPMMHNPLRDARVRQAMSEAIDRATLVARIMSGQGVPAGQYVPEGYPGYDPRIPIPKYEPKDARWLLAAAGYPDGFSLTVHGPTDRYTNAGALLQAIAQEFSRIGIITQVNLQPGAVYFSRASKLEFSVIMGGAAVETGEASSVLYPLMATYNPVTGAGTGNRGRWSDPRFDALLDEALHTLDTNKRNALLQQAARIASKDVAIIPVLWLDNIWGLRSGFTYAPRSDGYTLAAAVSGGTK
jgi:peptide/nickel transport system substrate-binding protein